MYIKDLYELYDGTVVLKRCTAEDGPELRQLSNGMITS